MFFAEFGHRAVDHTKDLRSGAEAAHNSSLRHNDCGHITSGFSARARRPHVRLSKVSCAAPLFDLWLRMPMGLCAVGEARGGWPYRVIGSSPVDSAMRRGRVLTPFFDPLPVVVPPEV